VYANLVIENTLLAMREDEPAAAELFPRLLHIIETYPATQKTFKEQVSSCRFVHPATMQSIIESYPAMKTNRAEMG